MFSVLKSFYPEVAKDLSLHSDCIFFLANANKGYSSKSICEHGCNVFVLAGLLYLCRLFS